MKLFITGTDTGVGKTWVSAAIAAQGLQLGKAVRYYKPIQTGVPLGAPPEDPDFIQSTLQGQVETYCRYCFEPPVTPSVADPEGRIQLETIVQDVEQYGLSCDLLLVEGAGGLAVPINAKTLMIDLIQRLNIPVLLVAHSRLGTLNHTLLSVEALEHRGIPIHGIIVNFYPEDIENAPLSVQTLIPTLTQHLDQSIPVWICMASPCAVPSIQHLKTDFIL